MNQSPFAVQPLIIFIQTLTVFCSLWLLFCKLNTRRSSPREADIVRYVASPPGRPKNPFPFLRLPAEIRIMIYELVLIPQIQPIYCLGQQHIGSWYPRNTRLLVNPTPQLFYTSRRVRQEAEDVWYQNWFLIDFLGHWEPIIRQAFYIKWAAPSRFPYEKLQKIQIWIHADKIVASSYRRSAPWNQFLLQTLGRLQRMEDLRYVQISVLINLNDVETINRLYDEGCWARPSVFFQKAIRQVVKIIPAGVMVAANSSRTIDPQFVSPSLALSPQLREALDLNFMEQTPIFRYMFYDTPFSNDVLVKSHILGDLIKRSESTQGSWAQGFW